MCFSFEVSIGTFIVSWSIGLYLLTKKLKKTYRHNVIFLLIFSSMQLADAILWSSKFKKNSLNYWTTSLLIPFILSLQVLYNLVYRNNYNNIFTYTLVILTCIYLFVRFNGYTNQLCHNRFASPVWGSNEIKFWEIMMFMLLIMYPNIKGAFYTFITLIPLIHIIAGGAYGSLWCAVSNVLAFYFLYKY